jgi:hypothetical protein
MKDILINNNEYFTKDTIERIKTKYKFNQTIHIELLIWDFEIFTQLSKISGDIILKGGAATQIYLDTETQRTSRDIDFATTHSKKEIEAALDKIKERFKEHKTHEEHFIWDEVPPPKEPSKTIEDLNCYNVHVPTFFGSSKGKSNITLLKIDAIRYEKIPFKVKSLANPKIFDLELKPIKIISEGSLIADKLLTLADQTVGILARKPDDIEGYLKQVYDLTHLIHKFIDEDSVQKDILETLEKLTPIEVKYRGLKKSVEEVLQDIIISLDKRKYSDYDSSEAGQEFNRLIENFQGEYINTTERQTRNEWAARLRKLSVISALLLKVRTKDITEKQLEQEIKRLFAAEKTLLELKGIYIQKKQEELVTYFDGPTSIKKQLKRAPLKRIFYGIITPENKEEIFKIIGV